MATLSVQFLSSPELGPKCANLHLVLISFWALTTGSIFSNQTLEIQQRLQMPGFGGLLALKVLQMPGFGGLLALKMLQIPGFGRFVALKVLLIPGSGGPLALKMLQIPGFGGSHCTESAANSKTWWPDTVNFQGLGARVHESNVNTGPSVIIVRAGISKTGKTLHSNSPQTDFKARDSEGRILKPQILKARIPKTGTLASHTS